MNLPPANVSAIIPIIGPGEHLAEAIESVVRQTIPPREVIVVGGAEGTSEIARLFDGFVRFVQTRNTQVWGACNLGVTLSGGSILAFLGSNDRWKSEKLQIQVDLLQTRPEIGIVLGQSARLEPTEVDERAADLGLLAGTMIVRRQSFLRNGFFEDADHAGIFSTWLSRAKKRGLGMNIVPDVVLEKRILAVETPTPLPVSVAAVESSSARNGD